MFSFIKDWLDRNRRETARLRPAVDRINALEPSMHALTDAALRAKTDEFRARMAGGETLDDILPEAFAVVREAATRTIGQRHFDVQLMGGMVLHQGKIAEMKTGEGKTLVASLPAYLNGLTGKGVHIVTVNDYLAERDSTGKGNFKGMGNIYEFLGLTAGCILHPLTWQQRKAVYACDITYGTNNEFGFDYLRDNMAVRAEAVVQRGFNYAIVDEVDSILIDEARTPLIISGPAEESTELYFQINRIIPRLGRDTDYKIDEKHKNVTLTEGGVFSVEKLLKVENLYDEGNVEILHHVVQGLRAHTLFKREVDYIIKEGKVLIVDEFTGRLMPGRRWSDGLHQAIEAKEGVTIEEENQTMASITLQNYFRMYSKLAGMTGTAATEAAEFMEIYRLDCITVPTNQPMVRIDHGDAVYRTEGEKFQAIVEDLKDCHEKGQPVLVGTTSIEKNERLSGMLKRRGVPHEVLNAKQHEREASIIALAGQPAAVTVATNMAGRGTDIVLGEGVPGKGGLYVLGTERHESRRIDNQLRGRCGRQGDPGASRFYLSLEDDLLRLFGSENLKSWMQKLGMQEGEVIEHPWVSKSIERAQKAVEARNFDMRKHLLEYDDVMNKQREVIYTQRRATLAGEDISAQVRSMIDEVVGDAVDAFLPPKSEPEEGAHQSLADWVKSTFALGLSAEELSRQTREDILLSVTNRLRELYTAREREFGPEAMRELERMVMLDVIDGEWKGHLYSMDQLKEGIGLAAYGQKDPLLEYKREGYGMFAAMLGRMKQKTLEILFHVRSFARHEEPGKVWAYNGKEERPTASIPLPPPQMTPSGGFPMGGSDASGGLGPGMMPPGGFPPGMGPEAFAGMGGGPDGAPPGMAPPQRITPIRRETPKVGRNEPCPCGSGKKYKKCCGAASKG